MHFYINKVGKTLAKTPQFAKLMVESRTKWEKVGESVFIGEYRHSLDAKNRMIVPSKFREQLGDTFVVTRWLDGCLTIYKESQWIALTEKLETIPMTNKAGRDFIRMLMSKAVECSVDNQGRIQLSQALLDAADIDKKVCVIGASNHVEIWSEEKWDAYNEENAESFTEEAESLTEFLR